MATTVIYQKRGAEKVKVAETPDLSPYAIKADVDAELATKADAEDLGITNKRVDNLAALLNGALSVQNTDSTSAYAKTVPAKVQPYAAIDAIGGKTLCWNQLVNSARDSFALGGLTFTKNGRSITISGTADATNNYSLLPSSMPKIDGHVYLLDIGAPATSGYYAAFGTDNAQIGESGFIYTATAESGNYNINFHVENGTEVNVTVTPNSIDLTLMFGAGNEPSTVAEFQAQFPTINPAYNAGTLISAGVTGAVSRGFNLFDKSTAKLGYFINGNDISASAANDAHSEYIAVDPGQTYYCNASKLTGVNWIFEYDENKNVLNKIGDPTNPFTVPTNCRYVRVNMPLSELDAVVLNVYGSLNGTYKPYRAPITLPIPAAVQALPGYGWSAGSVYNYIDWQRKVYVQRVASVDMGTLTWFWSSTYSFVYARVPNIHSSSTTDPSNLITSKYPTTAEYWNLMPDKTIRTYSNIFQTGVTELIVKDSGYSDAATFKTAMDGVYLYYELETPVETDISAYLTDDNLIEVEPGGTISFPSVLGNDYRIPVPSDVEYTIDMAPDTPSTDGTYTLQCVVADGVPTYSWVTA